MAEILTLREVFRREGIQFIEKLFNSYVIISEKLNAKIGKIIIYFYETALEL